MVDARRYKTPWDKINVDVLIEETKKLTKDIKTLNKAVRNYEVYRLLEESLKAMLTSLPLVQVRQRSSAEQDVQLHAKQTNVLWTVDKVA